MTIGNMHFSWPTCKCTYFRIKQGRAFKEKTRPFGEENVPNFNRGTDMQSAHQCQRLKTETPNGGLVTAPARTIRDWGLRIVIVVIASVPAFINELLQPARQIIEHNGATRHLLR